MQAKGSKGRKHRVNCFTHFVYLNKKPLPITSAEANTSRLSSYIYPPTFRTKISEHWNISGLEDWWLPNEEGLVPIVKSVRAFVEERTTKTTNPTTEDVKNMKAMFSKLNVTDSPKQSPESSSSQSGEPSVPPGMGVSFGPVTFGPTFPGHPDPHLRDVPEPQIQAPNMWFDPIVEPVDPAWDLSDMHMGTNQQFYPPTGQ